MGAVQESPFLDYDNSFNDASFGDTSFDFDMSAVGGDLTQGQMFGDLPGSNKSDSPVEATDLPEKRSRPEGDEPEGGAKRRESTEKVPKKPGRKPLTSEPSSKRKAQNRAAQRAFRERKEKHLKDLETKVEELEKASEAANHENGLLRTQVEKMTTELNEYKKRFSLLTNTRSLSNSNKSFQWGRAAISNLNDVNFHFEFPKFGTLPGPPAASPSNYSHKSPGSVQESQASPKTQVAPSPASTFNSMTSSTPLATDTFTDFTGFFGNSSAFGNNTTTNASRTSFDSAANFSLGPTATSSPSASSNSNMGTSSSCGTSPEPCNQSPLGFKPIDSLTTIGEENLSTATPSGQRGLDATASNNMGPLGSLDFNNFDWFANQNSGGNFDPQLFGDYREPQQNVLSTGLDGLNTFTSDVFDDIDFLTPFNAPEAISQPKKDILAELDAKKMDDEPTLLTSKPPPNFHGQLLTCTKIWEKLQKCPKVQQGDFDLDSLCDDLKKKAKCTGSGPMIDEKDFKAVIGKYVKNDDCSKQALAQVQSPAKA